MKRNYLVIDFEASCNESVTVIERVITGNLLVSSKHGLTTSDQVKYSKETRNTKGGSLLRVSGQIAKDGTIYFIRAIDENTLKLFDTEEDAMQDQNPVLIDEGTGTNAVLQAHLTSRHIAAVSTGGVICSKHHCICTGTMVKYKVQGGTPLLVDGTEILDGSEFFVRAVSINDLMLFKTKSDAEHKRNAIAVAEGTGANTVLFVGNRWVHEIIEFPCVLVDAESLEIIAQFRELVSPTETPFITPFCTQLTTIQQADIEAGNPLGVVLDKLGTWLVAHGAQDALPVTCGDWDLGQQLQKECERKGLSNAVPLALTRWCNIKVPFTTVFGYKAPGMSCMLRDMSINLEGHHHLGIDDSRNIARILQKLVRQYGAAIEVTGHAEHSQKKATVRASDEEIAQKRVEREARKAAANAALNNTLHAIDELSLAVYCWFSGCRP